jgi:general secretion pathway protein G
MRPLNTTTSVLLRAGAKGFTLVEIMVVVVIIGLLAAMVAPSLMERLDTATVTRVKQDIRAIETALNLYRLENHRYPSTDEGLQVLTGGDGRKEFLRRVPVDPWNNPYQYVYPGRHGEFDVFSLGADGREGGEGINADIGNWDID